MVNSSVIASAPGKVILFGEHAVVYGVTAIAAALSDLRIYVEVNSVSDDSLEVLLHDIIMPNGESFARITSLDRMRDLFKQPIDQCESASSPINPDEIILEKLRQEYTDAPSSAAQGLMAIVYLTSQILPGYIWGKKPSGGLRFDVRSKGLPIGAGLGSSAAFSVALSAALLRLSENQKQHSLEETINSEKLLETVTLSNPNFSGLTSSITIPNSLLPLINGWAYAAEVVIHGTPSGLDNTTSCYGGAVRFKKGEDKFENISQQDLPAMRILLTNTRVPRSTKLLVASVRVLYEELPQVIKPIYMYASL